MSNAVVAQREGISRTTLYKVEAGDPGATLGSYIRVLAALGLEGDINQLAADDKVGRKLQDFALSPFPAAVLAPYIKALKSMPRIILAPIFAIWFGLGIGSKIALGVTLVFFVVFLNVYQGVPQVSRIVLANARMLGAPRRRLLRHVYLASATVWVFSSLHTSVSMAFVGAFVGECPGSDNGVGHLILQAEGIFDINTVMVGIVVLTVCSPDSGCHCRKNRSSFSQMAASGR